MGSDGELLRQYLGDGRQAAFTALVDRHLNLVYRTALRRVGGDAHAANDVTQRVFVALAQKASALSRHPSLAGWLYTSTRYAAAEFVRGEQRRRLREQQAQIIDDMNHPLRATATEVEAFLDDALATLPRRDREAVLLHYLEGKTFGEVAALTASTGDAVRMRVTRALERVRTQLERRGIASTAAALSLTLSAQSAAAATLPEVGPFAYQILAKSTAVHAATFAGKWLPMLKFTGVTGGLLVVAALGVWVYESPKPSDASGPTTVASSSATLAPTDSNVTPSAPPESAAVSSAARSLPIASIRSTASEFEALSFEEKNLLAIFWKFYQSGQRTAVLFFARGSLNYRGLDPLVDRRWLTELPMDWRGRRRVKLAPAGADFCARHRAAVEAYTPTANLRPER